MNNFLSIRLSVTIFFVSTGFYLASGSQENCICELDNSLNCTKFRCPINKCGNFSSSYNLTCLCEKKADRKNGCQAFNFSAGVQTQEDRSCDEHHSFICSDSNDNFQIYTEENKTWTEAVKTCEQRNLHIAHDQARLSTINHTSNVLFWIGTFFGQALTSDTNVSQYQMTVDISEMNSTSAIYATCEIQSEMFRLTTTSVSPTSPTSNLTTESMSRTPCSNATIPVTEIHTTDTTHIITTKYESTERPSSTETEASSATPVILTSPEMTTTIDVSVISSSYGRPLMSSPCVDKSTTERFKASSTETTTNYERTGGTSSTDQEPVTSPSETSASPAFTTTSDDKITSSVGTVTVSSTSDILTSPKVTITSDKSIVSSLPESHSSTSSFVYSATTHHGKRTDTPSTLIQIEPSATTQSADTMSVTNTKTLSTVSNTAVEPKPGNGEAARQDDQDNTPVIAGAISGVAVLIIIGATVLYIRYRRNQNQAKKPISKSSGIAGYTDKSLRGKPFDHSQSQNPIYLASDESPHVHGNHGQETAAESDDENNYDHFDKTKKQKGFESENDMYDHARLDTQVDSTYGYGVLHQEKDCVVDDVYDHTGALTEGTYGHLHQKDETSQPDSDTYDTSRL